MPHEYTTAFIDHFWERVTPRDACRVWTGGHDRDGYARVRTPHGRQQVHRVAWQLVHGAIPEGLHVCHTCDVRDCCDPDHLFLGTQAENMQDASQKGRLGGWAAVDRRDSAPWNKGKPGRWWPHDTTRGPRGEQVKSAKLTEDQVREIRRSYAHGEASLRVLASRFGIPRQHVSRIVRRQAWAHIP